MIRTDGTPTIAWGRSTSESRSLPTPITDGRDPGDENDYFDDEAVTVSVPEQAQPGILPQLTDALRRTLELAEVSVDSDSWYAENEGLAIDDILAGARDALRAAEGSR